MFQNSLTSRDSELLKEILFDYSGQVKLIGDLGIKRYWSATPMPHTRFAGTVESHSHLIVVPSKTVPIWSAEEVLHRRSAVCELVADKQEFASENANGFTAIT